MAKEVKEKKLTKASAILDELIAGGTLGEIAERAGAKLGVEALTLNSQVRGLISNIEKGKGKKWGAYKVVKSEDAVKVEKIA